jgi:large subunit ribosomal protein L4e
MMEANIYGLDGEIIGKIQLQRQFEEEYRPDLIRKAVTVIRANRRQPYGSDPLAGKKHSTESWRPGRGVSRIPRLSQGRRGALAPGTVGGRRAHPPLTEKKWKKKMNKKEMEFAKRSAIAATSNRELVRKRGHRFSDDLSLPIIVDDEIEKFSKTKEVVDFMKKLGVNDDLFRAKKGKHIRAGRGKLRGRKYRIPKSALIVASKKAKKEKIDLAARNLLGVDVKIAEELTVEDLAPGGDPGRLTIFTKSSLEEL